MRNEENTIKVYADKILFIFASLYNMNEVLTGQLDIFGSHRTSENKSTFHPTSSFFSDICRNTNQIPEEKYLLLITKYCKMTGKVNRGIEYRYISLPCLGALIMVL